jgi:hypothetical protein
MKITEISAAIRSVEIQRLASDNNIPMPTDEDIAEQLSPLV